MATFYYTASPKVKIQITARSSTEALTELRQLFPVIYQKREEAIKRQDPIWDIINQHCKSNYHE